MTRTALLTTALLGLLLASPVALAQDDAQPERPDDAAWVDDCPPDMMCAAGAEGEGPDEPTYDGDCGGEVCAYDGEPGTLGPEGCIDCMTPPKDAGPTCMDGQQAGEACDDVQHVSPPAEGGPQQAQSAQKASVPGASLAAALGILAVAALGLALIAGRRA